MLSRSGLVRTGKVARPRRLHQIRAAGLFNDRRWLWSLDRANDSPLGIDVSPMWSRVRSADAHLALAIPAAAAVARWRGHADRHIVWP